MQIIKPCPTAGRLSRLMSESFVLVSPLSNSLSDQPFLTSCLVLFQPPYKFHVNHRVSAGLPIVWVPLTRQLLRWLGLGGEDTTVTSKSAYALGSHNHASSARARTSRRDVEGDSVEELMFDGIKMTRRFSAHVVEEDRGQKDASPDDRPWEKIPKPPK